MLKECEDCKTATPGEPTQIGVIASLPPAAPPVDSVTPPVPTATLSAITASDNTGAMTSSDIGAVYTPPSNSDSIGDTVPTATDSHSGASYTESSSDLTPTSSVLPLANPTAEEGEEHAPCAGDFNAQPTETPPLDSVIPPFDTVTPAPTSTPPLTDTLSATETISDAMTSEPPTSTTAVVPLAETTPPTTPDNPLGPAYVKGDIPLWDQRPTRSDMAPLLGKDESWKELAAVADAIINVSPG